MFRNTETVNRVEVLEEIMNPISFPVQLYANTNKNISDTITDIGFTKQVEYPTNRGSWSFYTKANQEGKNEFVASYGNSLMIFGQYESIQSVQKDLEFITSIVEERSPVLRIVGLPISQRIIIPLAYTGALLFCSTQPELSKYFDKIQPYQFVSSFFVSLLLGGIFGNIANNKRASKLSKEAETYLVNYNAVKRLEKEDTFNQVKASKLSLDDCVVNT